VPTPEPTVSGTLVAPPGRPTALGGTCELDCVAGRMTLVERPVVVVEPPLVERMPLDEVWASARAELLATIAAARQDVR
jgi:hypothetical protein